MTKRGNDSPVQERFMAEPEPPLEISEADLHRAFGKKPKWLVPALISLGSVALVAVLYFAGGKFLPTVSTPSLSLKVPDPKPITEEFAQFLTDSLGENDLDPDAAADTTDTLSSYIAKLTGSSVDTSSVAVDLPTSPLDSIHGLMAARVTTADLMGDTTSSLEEYLITPITGQSPLELPRMPWETPAPQPQGPMLGMDTLSTQPLKAEISAKDSVEIAIRQAQIDSLSIQLSASERALMKATDDRTKMADKLDRLGTAIDSARSAELKRLGKILETMKPGAAAQMLAGRTPAEVMEILFKVKPRTAAQIMQYLPPTLASDIAARVVRR